MCCTFVSSDLHPFCEFKRVPPFVLTRFSCFTACHVFMGDTKLFQYNMIPEFYTICFLECNVSRCQLFSLRISILHHWFTHPYFPASSCIMCLGFIEFFLTLLDVLGFLPSPHWILFTCIYFFWSDTLNLILPTWSAVGSSNNLQVFPAKLRQYYICVFYPLYGFLLKQCFKLQ